MTSWYPLNVRESGEYDNYDALSEGVPAWIRTPLIEFIVDRFLNHQAAYRDLVTSKVRSCGAAVRVVLPESDYNGAFRKWLRGHATDRPGLLLTIVDWLVATEGAGHRSAVEKILASGNSAWTVGEWGDGHVGLVRRVDATATAAAARAISAKTAASHHLAEAWQAAYGLNGDPSKAYREAVKAVEFAVIPVVIPKDAGATLGKVLGQVRSDGDWIIPLTREKDSGDVAGMLLSMLEALWVGQSDRHGSTLPPIPITPEAAQAAVLMATTLVQWFQSGAVRRGTI